MSSPLLARMGDIVAINGRPGRYRVIQIVGHERLRCIYEPSDEEWGRSSVIHLNQVEVGASEVTVLERHGDAAH